MPATSDAAPAAQLPVVGLVPAAGQAARLGALPCSKEIFPVGFDQEADGPRPKPVCLHLLDAYRRACIDRALVLLRRDKWDIPACLGSSVRGPLDRTGPLDRQAEAPALELAYRVLDPTPSVPATLNAARPFLGEARVALGFPDILFHPQDAFVKLVALHDHGKAEVVLGLFPTDQPEKTDMVELEEQPRGERAGRAITPSSFPERTREPDAPRDVRRIVIKQPDRGLAFTWSIAVWGPAFTDFLAAAVERAAASSDGRELYVGDVLQEAIDQGLRVCGIPFPEGSYLDVGTPEDLRRAVAAGVTAEESP